MRYAVALVLVFCVAGGVALGDDLEDCVRAIGAEDWQAAVALCTKAAEQGHAEAQYNLGGMYDFGYGVPQDYARAFEWYTKAAEQGDAGAQYKLGMMYEVGNGAPRDDAKAVEWYTKAAEQGDAWAQANLAELYVGGESVPENFKMAYFWLNLAAVLDDDPEERKQCAEGLDKLAKEMTPQDISEAQRMSAEWLERFKARQKDE